MVSAVRFTIEEYIANWKLMFKMARVSMSQTTIRSTWGVAWIYIHDLLYFSAFVLFRILLTGNRNVGGLTSVEYLVTGLVPWMIISEILNSATNAIRTNKVIIQSIKFPIIILPGVEVLSILMKRLPTVIFVFITCIYYGHLMCINLFLVLYYIFAMIVLLFAITLLFSAINAISDDFHQVYTAVMKVLFFSLPIMWDYENLAGTAYETLGNILALNPLIYIIRGFRDAFVLGNTQPWQYTLYFWGITIVLFLLGCLIQKGLQKFYSDFL